jgi:Flp pilus assembly protein TadG
MAGAAAAADAEGMLRRYRRRQEGQALVEFAIVANLLVVLLLAIANFGVIWMNYIAVTDAAREGARRAVVNRSAGQAGMISAGTSAARNATSALNQANLGVSVTSQSGTWNQGDPIQVTVTYPYAVSILGWAVKSGSLTSSTVMRAE